MGIWQIHAMSSILKVPICSIYPKMGNHNVRLDLNRIFVPREFVPGTDETPVYILWTSNRHRDMTHEHWVPNHFVVVVPIDHNTCPSNDVINVEADDPELTNDKEHDVEMKEGYKVNVRILKGRKKRSKSLNV